MLAGAKKVISDDGTLILQFTNPVDEGYFKQDEQKQLDNLRNIIQNTIGKEIALQTRTVSVETDNQFADLSELIHFDGIEYK